MTGEQHERAVEAIDPNGSAYGLSPLALGQIIERYFASLAEQGVRLVDLREVVEYMRMRVELSTREYYADAIKRRFGGSERSE